MLFQNNPKKFFIRQYQHVPSLRMKLQAGVFPQDLLRQLRSIMQHQTRLVLVLSGSHHLDEIRRQYWNPMRDIAQVFKVEYLSDTAIEKLITNPWPDFPLEYEKEAVQLIIRSIGGQPLLAQTIGYHVLERVNLRLVRGGAEISPTATLEDVETVIKEVLQKSEYFEAVSSALPEDALTLLKTIARVQTKPLQWLNPATIPMPRLQDPEKCFKILKRRDMITEQEGKISISVELVRQWLLIDSQK